VTNEEALAILSGIEKVAGSLPPPLGEVLTVLAMLGEDALRIATAAPNANAVALLQQLRGFLRQNITAEWQAKLDAQFPKS
jgi:hypothetical protein